MRFKLHVHESLRIFIIWNKVISVNTDAYSSSRQTNKQTNKRLYLYWQFSSCSFLSVVSKICAVVLTDRLMRSCRPTKRSVSPHTCAWWHGITAGGADAKVSCDPLMCTLEVFSSPHDRGERDVTCAHEQRGATDASLRTDTTEEQAITSIQC